MTSEPLPRRLREDSLVQIGGIFTKLSATVYEPVRRVGTVLCVHGFAGTGLDFEPLANALVDRGYRLVCPDMFGRGHSAYANDPRHYTIPTYMQQMAGLLAKYQDRDTTLVGAGWGALIGLLLVNLTSFQPSRLVLCDLQPNWSADIDPGLQLVKAFADRHFDSRDTAEREVLAYGAFAGVGHRWSGKLAAGRIQQAGSQFRYAADPRLVPGMSNFARGNYEVTRMLAPLEMPAMLLWGQGLSGHDRDAVVAALGKTADPILADGLNPLGSVWFTTPEETDLAIRCLDRGPVEGARG
jgi:pimeloyl-ACP methyl ester carboxylesterase